MINSVIACLFLFVFGAVLFVVNATAPFWWIGGMALLPVGGHVGVLLPAKP